MSDRLPIVGKPVTSGQLLTRKQGYVRARGGQVEFYMPGLYTGPTLPPGKVEKIATKGIADSLEHAKRGTFVPLKIPGHYNGHLPADQALILFRRLLAAAQEAKRQHDNAHVLLLTEQGARYVN